MSEYTQRFIENRFDLIILPDLMDQDLEKMGVCSAIAAKCWRRELGNAPDAPLREDGKMPSLGCLEIQIAVP